MAALAPAPAAAAAQLTSTPLSPPAFAEERAKVKAARAAGLLDDEEVAAQTALLLARLDLSLGASAKPKLPVVLCGPSGVGKTTLIKKLQADFPDEYGFGVPHTTRSPREGEVDGKDYHFVSGPEARAKMEADIAAGKFLESTKVHDHLYGTTIAAVEAVTAKGKTCLVDADVQGVASARKAGAPVSKYVYVAPPKPSVLEARLRARKIESDENIAKRVGNADRETNEATGKSWDAWIVNDDLDQAYTELMSLMNPK